MPPPSLRLGAGELAEERRDLITPTIDATSRSRAVLSARAARASVLRAQSSAASDERGDLISTEAPPKFHACGHPGMFLVCSQRCALVRFAVLIAIRYQEAGARNCAIPLPFSMKFAPACRSRRWSGARCA